MKTGFLQLGRIGDMVLCTAAFSAIKRKYPDAEIYVISGSGNAEVLSNNPNIKQVIRLVKTPTGIAKLFVKLKTMKFDYWIDPKNHYSKQSNIIANIVRAKRKIYFQKNSAVKSENKFFTDIVFDTLQELDIPKPQSPILPEMFPDSNAMKIAQNNLISNGKKNIFINISATSALRIYSADNWISVLSDINTDDMNIYINSMPDEIKTAYRMSASYPGIKLLPKLNISELAAFISKCDLVISPDTAIVHIAAAFRKNTVALYTDDKENLIKFGTNNPNAEIIKITNGADINQIPPNMISNSINKYIN